MKKARRKSPSRSQLQIALTYAARGFPVLPLHTISKGRCTCSKGAACASPGKHPRTSNGVYDASTNAKKIARLFKRYPRANIGIATGPKSGILVLDVDPRRGGNS